MPKDMRDWIRTLDKAGELHTVKRPVDPRTEMGALLYQSREKGLLFESLTGHPGWRALGQAPANLRHAALAFGTALEQLIPTVAERMTTTVPCRTVASGPVKEVIKKVDQVNLFDLQPPIAGPPRIEGGNGCQGFGSHVRDRQCLDHAQPDHQVDVQAPLEGDDGEVSSPLLH